MSYRFVFLLLLMFAAACMEDKCISVSCVNEGVCVQGKCACPYAYEGEFCQVRWQEKFTGSWMVQETGNKDTLGNYSLTVFPGSSPDTFYIIGLAQIVDTVVCTRKAYKVFNMTERVLSDSLKMQGGEGMHSEQTGKVTGVYSFLKQDVITTVSFTWSK